MEAGLDIEKAMKNPAATFGTPEALIETAGLTPDQKRAILLQWKDQLHQLLAAEDENMRAPGAATGATADCLRRVTNFLTALEPHV
jgi:hypothetical protein